ncbi:MAG: hypothetical protein KJ578_13075 [Bacteroidetes bacterium]|nr:hypothetical protein [Bacteroidota bacterium]MBU1578959.1 hypothetical protein [Bacteroidota bacterium]MBU2466095.1 hypothetical protein [Bacteroidota bacterium]MBU2558702.1 hypothetical protein [Bacteroidota bacterium]
MAFKWRKWNRAIHRDFGYLFFGMTVIYALSGIAINHRHDWNPNYVIISEEIVEQPVSHKLSKEEVLAILKKYDVADDYRKHYYPYPDYLKVFLNGGIAVLDQETGIGSIDITRKRLLFRDMNYLHYNPSVYWTWFSDLYAGALILLALSGILIPRGADGITARGAWLTLLGIAVPFIFVIYYLY